tara:strand:- start:134 stop:358 length:225 start_codon:yes stop_codon:yes gene_type:complete
MSRSKLIREKKKVHGSLYVIECPKCGHYAASAEELESLPDFVVCQECYPTKLLNDVIRMDYRKRFSRLGTKDSL